MLKSLHLENFKCFSGRQIDFAPLTLLTGVNGSGKSSVIQALLLLRQSLNEPGGALNRQDNREASPPKPFSPQLSGMLCNIGLPEDILYSLAGNNRIALSLHLGDQQYRASWQVEKNTVLPGDLVSPNPPVLSRMLYLNAERIAPGPAFPVPSP
ncbi:MAG: AAA family ATPase, partial [Candidatus Adiutrix sp.]|nr:AAA family ATPase [Candidatus Adiutrix sp.]